MAKRVKENSGQLSLFDLMKSKEVNDYIGSKFGAWIIIEKSNLNKKNHNHLFKVQCQCGVTRVIAIYDLKSGKSKGCLQCWNKKLSADKAIYIQNKVNLLVNKKFGRWQVVNNQIKRKNYNSGQSCILVFCKCDCGTVSFVDLYSLINNNTLGCNKCNIRWHGESQNAIYKIWGSMKARCLNKKTKNYMTYGGRGIKICDRWLKFVHFFNDMGPRPFSDAEIDRIDPDGHYEPANCRWVTPEENLMNRRISPKNLHKYVLAKKENLCKSCLKTATLANKDFIQPT